MSSFHDGGVCAWEVTRLTWPFRYHVVQEFNKGVYDYIIATDESGGKGEEDSEDEEESEEEADSDVEDKDEQDGDEQEPADDAAEDC